MASAFAGMGQGMNRWGSGAIAAVSAAAAVAAVLADEASVALILLAVAVAFIAGLVRGGDEPAARRLITGVVAVGLSLAVIARIADLEGTSGVVMVAAYAVVAAGAVVTLHRTNPV